MTTTTFYHAVCNGYDKPRPVKDVGEHADYTCVVGVTRPDRAALWNRFWKIVSPPMLNDYSVYMDGNIAPQVPSLLLNDWAHEVLQDADIAICRHAARGCAYVEIEACVGRKKITSEQAATAHNFLSERKLPKNYGLWECGIIVRRSQADWLGELQEKWLTACIDTGVVRDQLWLPLALWELGNKVPPKRFKTIDLNVRKNTLFDFRPHV